MVSEARKQLAGGRKNLSPLSEKRKSTGRGLKGRGGGPGTPLAPATCAGCCHEGLCRKRGKACSGDAPVPHKFLVSSTTE